MDCTNQQKTLILNRLINWSYLFTCLSDIRDNDFNLKTILIVKFENDYYEKRALKAKHERSHQMYSQKLFLLLLGLEY